MKKLTESDSNILERVAREFSRFRNENSDGTPRYPLHLKQLAIEAIKHGHKQSRVASEARVSYKSLTNWTQSQQIVSSNVSFKENTKPRELIVVNELAPTQASALTIQVHFLSGIRMEVPTQVVTSAFISMLGAL